MPDLVVTVPQGEQFNLELPDLHVKGTDPHVYVRFGSKGEPPKNGKHRRVYLSPEALAVCKRWLDVLPTYATANPCWGRSSSPPRGGVVRPSGMRGCAVDLAATELPCAPEREPRRGEVARCAVGVAPGGGSLVGRRAERAHGLLPPPLHAARQAS